MINSVFIVKKVIVLVQLIFVTTLAMAQKNNPTTSFYRHFNGTLDTSMHISFDLFFQEGKITGSYYYFFPEPGNLKSFYYGKTIPLQGTIEADRVSLREFMNEGSSFSGLIEKQNKITGTWQRKPGEKSIPFSVSEDYSNGSLPFTCYKVTNSRNLKKGKHGGKNSPKASIDLVLLYPNLPAKNPLKDSLDFLITKYLYVDTVPFKTPELLLANITFDFFDSYFRATDGIENVEAMASFNWEKKVSMDVIFNERNIASLKIEKYAFTGGAHGIAITKFVVCDLKHNKPLSLKDILKDNYEETLNLILNNKLRKMNGIKPEENLKDAGFFAEKIDTSDNFYINKDGVGFYYNHYHIAPFSAGPTELFLTFSELREILDTNSSFFWNKAGDEITER